MSMLVMATVRDSNTRKIFRKTQSIMKKLLLRIVFVEHWNPVKESKLTILLNVCKQKSLNFNFCVVGGQWGVVLYHKLFQDLIFE